MNCVTIPQGAYDVDIGRDIGRALSSPRNNSS